jgi:hypothetical protein
MKFCGNCGVELRATKGGDYVEALAVLHITSSLFMLLTLGSNYLVYNVSLFLILYAVVGVAGLYVGYEMHRGGSGRWLKVASATAIGLGLITTSFLYLVGLSLGGLIGPAWVLFVMCALLLWISRKNL